MTKHFKVVLEKESDGGFSVFVPSLPGCATQGETMEEAITNIKEALELYIQSLKKDGLPIPSSDVEIIVRDIEVSV